MKKRILFVCLGNICRSPAAEAVMTHLAHARGIDVEIDSAGTIGMHAGNFPDPRMRSAGESRGYQFLTKARQLTADDLGPKRFDLVLAMDRSNLANIRRLSRVPLNHVLLFGEFLDKENPPDIPDPYYGGAEGFTHVLDMLETGCARILDSLEEDDFAR
jgi:protein-tyrosine phosphatase